jgi:tetratricopeptide (TPR) repeat protein
MFKSLVVAAAWLLPAWVWAQAPSSPWQQELARLARASESERAAQLPALAARVIPQDPEQGLLLAERALQAAVQSNSKQAQARALYARGWARSRRGHFQTAESDFRAALDLVRDDQDEPLEGLILARLAGVLIAMARVDQGEAHLRQAREILERCGTDTGKRVLYSTMAVAHQTHFALQDALRNYLKALELAQAEADHWAEATLLYNIGTVQWGAHDIDSARVSWERAWTLLAGTGPSRVKGLLCSALAECAIEDGNLEEARRRFGEGAQIAKACGSPGLSALLERKLGELALRDGHADQARRHFLRSLELAREEGNPEAIASSATALARIALDQNPAAALAMAEVALQSSQSINMPVVDLEVTEVLSACHAVLGNHEEALRWQREYSQAVMLLEAEKRSAETTRLRLEHRLDLERLTAEKEIQHQRKQRNVGLCATLAISLLVIWLLRVLRQRAHLNQTLQQHNTEISCRNQQVNQLNRDLELALAEVKRLSGLLPMCSYCKAIRDDQGYWQELERYLSEHSEAVFSHGICPRCVCENFPENADQAVPASGN